MSNYTPTGNPPNQTRGISSLIRAEFNFIQTAINSKGDITGQTWTGTHQFPATIFGVTATPGSSGTALATLDYVNATASSVTLPGQALGFLRSTSTVASFGVAHTGYAQNEVKGADIASASTINLTTATGNFVHITGTTTITAITIPIGADRTVIFDGILTLTHGAGLLLPGAANITTAANDRMVVRGDTAGAIVVNYTKADGTTLKGGMTLLATITPTAAANVDFLTTFTASYDNCYIAGNGLNAALQDTLKFRFAVAGVVDAGSNYYTFVTSGGFSTTTSATSGLIESGLVVTTKGLSFSATILNVNDATNAKGLLANSIYQSNGTPTYSSEDARTIYPAANAISGIRFFWSGGNNFAATGKIRVYGYNNS